jgi:hypothetical protein
VDSESVSTPEQRENQIPAQRNDADDGSQSAKGDEFSLGEREMATTNVKTGRKQIQAKMMLQLNATDKACAARVMDAWKTMLSTTLRDKARDFVDLEDYLDFRIIDTGAP